MFRIFLSLVCVASLCAVVAVGEDELAGDLQKFQGTWKTVSAKVDGKDVTETIPPDLRLVFRKDRFSVESSDEGSFEATIKLDSSTDPKLIDFTRLDRETEKEITTEGIYQLDGDTLKICGQIEGAATVKQRPAKFEGSAGFALLVLERVK